MSKRRRHCRCRKCHARQVRRFEAKALVPPVSMRCKACGATSSLSIDKWADSRGWRKHTCYSESCDYGYPHRKGSPKCIYHKTGEPKSYEEIYGQPEDVSDAAGAISEADRLRLEQLFPRHPVLDVDW